MSQIISFSADYRFLSNFWPASVKMGDHWYPSVEHAYQAAKTDDPEQRRRIREAPTASAAKWLGKYVPLREGWNDLRIGIMEDLVRQKFACNAVLRQSLISTYPADLIEGNHWGDRFWGVCGNVGENHLGKILMKVREELRSAA